MNAGVVTLGGEEVPYELAFSARRTLGITVRPSGAVIVAAPAGTARASIEARLVKRAGWILKTRRDFDRMRPHTPPRRHVGGETHRYLGRQYLLVIEPEAPHGVTIDHERVRVGGIPPDEPNRVRNRLALWYQREARRVLEERFHRCWTQFGGSGRPPRLVIRPMEKRWGSLSATGRTMILNRRLVEADLDAIDFVIAHELCHLTHHHHGPEFINLLSARMPDWRKRQARLERWMA